MLRKFMVLLVCITVVSLAAAASADVPSLTLSSAEYEDENSDKATRTDMLNLPDGTGDEFADADDQDASIELTLRNSDGDPIENYPFEDLTLESTDVGATWFVCASGNVADGNTDVDGKAYWRNAMLAGGYTDPDNDMCQVYVSGAPLDGAGFNLQFNSCDLNGDGFVDLVDVGAFAQDFFPPWPPGEEDAYRSDFNHDGDVDLIDVGLLAPAFGGTCPGEG